MSDHSKIIEVIKGGGGDVSSLKTSRSHVKNAVSSWNAFNDQKFSVQFDGDKILIVKKPKKKIQSGYVKIAARLLKKVKTGESIEEELSSIQGYRSEEWTPAPLSVLPIPAPDMGIPISNTNDPSDPYDIINNLNLD